MTIFQLVHSFSKTQKLVDGLKHIIAINFDLPLVSKFPLGDRWQFHPFNVSQIIPAINSVGVFVATKGETEKNHPLEFWLITGLFLTVQGNHQFSRSLGQNGASRCRKIDEWSEGIFFPLSAKKDWEANNNA